MSFNAYIQVMHCKDLKANWDGEGAKEITEECFKAAKHFILNLDTNDMSLQTEVAPSPEGEILVYWRDTNVYVELNFDKYGTYNLQASILSPKCRSRFSTTNPFKGVPSLE